MRTFGRNPAAKDLSYCVAGLLLSAFAFSQLGYAFNGVGFFAGLGTTLLLVMFLVFALIKGSYIFRRHQIGASRLREYFDGQPPLSLCIRAGYDRSVVSFCQHLAEAKNGKLTYRDLRP